MSEKAASGANAREVSNWASLSEYLSSNPIVEGPVREGAAQKKLLKQAKSAYKRADKYYDNNNLDKAEYYGKESLRLLERIGKLNNIVYYWYWVWLTNDLMGRIYFKTNRYKQAEIQYKLSAKSLENYLNTSQQISGIGFSNFDFFQSELASAYNRVADSMLLANSDLKETEEYFRKAIAIYMELNRKNLVLMNLPLKI